VVERQDRDRDVIEAVRAVPFRRPAPRTVGFYSPKALTAKSSDTSESTVAVDLAVDVLVLNVRVEARRLGVAA